MGPVRTHGGTPRPPGARLAVGEDVSWAENARDQIAAFADLVTRRPHFRGPWTGTPDPALDVHLAELRDLITRHEPDPGAVRAG